MPRKLFASALLLLPALILAPGCDKEGDTAATPPPDSWAAFPFLRHVPAETEAFLAVHRPAGIGREIASAWAPLWSDPGLLAWWQGTAAGRLVAAFLEAPRTPPLLAALAAVPEEEMFIACGPGTGAQLAALQQVKRLFDAARVRNLFTPLPEEDVPPEEILPLEELPEDLATAAFTEVIVPLPPAMQETLEKFAREAAIPPLLIGAKLPDDSPLPALLEEWVETLPGKIPRDRVEAGGHGTFTRVRLPVTMLVPSPVAVRARDILATSTGDVYAATYLMRDLLSKVTTLGFGRMHGYFVVSLGSDSGMPELAAAPADSLALSPALQRLAPLMDEDAAAVFYADRLMVSLAAAPPPVAEYLDAAVESALEFAPAPTIDPLREQAVSLRAQAEELFRSRTTEVSGLVGKSDSQWRAELFGGSIAPRLSSGNAAPLFAPGSEVDVLWTENWEEGYAQRVLDFAAGLAAFAADWTKALGPVFLEAKRQAAVDAALRLVGEPITQLRERTGTLLRNALGPQVAMAVSFDGTMPPPPLLPESAAEAVLPRLALGAAMRDREALARGWEELTAGLDRSRWPLPVSSTEPGGAVTYEYPLPLGGPDLSAAVTLEGNRWLLGSSRTFNMEVASLPAPPAGRTAVQTVEFSTAPLATLFASWARALERDPSLAELSAGLFPSNPPSLRALAKVLKTPRRFRCEARWEQDTLHRVLELTPAP